VDRNCTSFYPPRKGTAVKTAASYFIPELKLRGAS